MRWCESLRFVPDLAEERVLVGILEPPLSNALDREHGGLSANIRRALKNLHGRVLPEHISEGEDPEEILGKDPARIRQDARK